MAAELQEACSLKSLEIIARIGQAIGVVDAQSVHETVTHQKEREFVRPLEDRGVLHTDGREFVDVEEAAVVDFVRRDAPERQAIGLIEQQSVEQIKAARVAGFAVEEPHILSHEFRDPRRTLQQRVQSPMDDFAFATTLGDFFGVGFRARRQVTDRGEDALVFAHVRVIDSQRLLEFVQSMLQDRSDRTSGDRESAVVVTQRERALLEGQHQLPLFQHLAELIAQDGQQNFVSQVRLQRHPVDVEERGVGRTGSVFQHVHPPRIVAGGDRHVVRHDVQNQTHFVVAQLADEFLELLVGADFRIKHRVVHDVVTVLASRARFQKRRRIAVRHAHRRQIRHELSSVTKRQRAIELQPIRRRRQRAFGDEVVDHFQDGLHGRLVGRFGGVFFPIHFWSSERVHNASQEQGPYTWNSKGSNTSNGHAGVRLPP